MKRSAMLLAIVISAALSLAAAREQMPLTVTEVAIDPTLRHFDMRFRNDGQTTITAWSVAVTMTVGRSSQTLGRFLFDSTADQAIAPVTAIAGGDEIRAQAALESAWPKFTSTSAVAVDAVLFVNDTAFGDREAVEEILNSPNRQRHIWREFVRALDIAAGATVPLDALDHVGLDARRSWPGYRVLARDQVVSLLQSSIDDARAQRRDVLAVIRQLRDIAEAHARAAQKR